MKIPNDYPARDDIIQVQVFANTIQYGQQMTKLGLADDRLFFV